MSFLLELESLIDSHSAKREAFKLVEPLWKILLLAKSSQPPFIDDNDCQQKWQMLMGCAKAYNAIPMDNMIQYFRQLTDALAAAAHSDPSAAPAIQFTGLLNVFMEHQEIVLHLDKNMTAYRNTQPLSDSIRMVLCNERCFFLSNNGQYGIGNPGVQKGDHLVLLFPDFYLPFILREVGDHFEMVGIAYIPPPLKEKALETASDQLREFIIV